jgi:hypothetical protein
LASEVRPIEPARLPDRLGFERSRIGKLRLKTDFSGKLTLPERASCFGASTPLYLYRGWRLNRAPWTARLFADYWFFIFLLNFGLDSAATGAASRRNAYLEKNWTLRRGIQSCLISAVHFS